MFNIRIVHFTTSLIILAHVLYKMEMLEINDKVIVCIFQTNFNLTYS